MQAQLKVVQNTESLRDAMVTRMIEREIVVNAHNAKRAKRYLPSSLSNLTNAKLKPVSSPAEITCISHFKSVIPKITSTCTCNKFYCRIIIGDHLTLAADADK